MREAEVLKYWFSELGPVESAILEILEKEPSTPFLAIARILNLSIERVMQSLQTLSAANAILIDIDDVLDASQRVVKVTPQGKKVIKDVKPMEEVFELRYVYGLRDNAGTELVIDTTRPFCKELCQQTAGVTSAERKKEGQLGGSKTWSLEQIISMGVKEDRNV